MKPPFTLETAIAAAWAVTGGCVRLTGGAMTPPFTLKTALEERCAVTVGCVRLKEAL